MPTGSKRLLTNGGAILPPQPTICRDLRLSLAFPPSVGYRLTVIKSWVDAHTNLPFRARWFAKADVARLWATKRKLCRPS